MMTTNLASSSQNKGGGQRYNSGRGQIPNLGNNSHNYRGCGHGNRGGRSNSYSSDKPQCQFVANLDTLSMFAITCLAYHSKEVRIKVLQPQTTKLV